MKIHKSIIIEEKAQGDGNEKDNSFNFNGNSYYNAISV